MKEKSTTGFVYIWFDIKRKMYYIGSHWGYVDDSYICSSTRMRNAYNRRPETFKRRVLKVIDTDRSDLLLEEQRWLDMIPREDFGVHYYNINSTVFQYSWWVNDETKKQVIEKLVDGHPSKKPSYKEIRQKISDSKKGRVVWNKGKKCPQISNSRKGIIFSEETKKKMSVARKGKKLSEETKNKISLANTGKEHLWNKGKAFFKGKTHSEESREKISLANKGKPGTFKDKHHSNETKKKMSLQRKGKIPWNKNKKAMWITNGITSKIIYDEQIPKGWNKGRN